MDNILPILNDMVIIFFDLLIFTKMISLKRDRLLNRAIMYVGCAVIIVLYFIATYKWHFPASLSSAACMSIPSFILFLLLSKHKGFRFLLTFCFVDTISLIIAFLGRYAGILTGRAGSFVSLAVTVLLFVGVLVIGNKHFKSYHALLEVVSKSWAPMAISTVLIYFALVFFAAYPRPLVERLEYGPTYIVFSAVVISCYIVFISSILKTRRIDEQNRQLEHEAEIYKMAYTDALTGLYNRASFIESINELERQKDHYQSVCCFAIDLNAFKSINDRRGHHMGDLSLCYVADSLRAIFGPDPQRIFRLGGDEFALLLLNTDKNTVTTYVDRLHERLHDAQSEIGVEITASVGYAYLSMDGHDTIEQAMIRADQEMYQNKRDWQRQHGLQPKETAREFERLF